MNTPFEAICALIDEFWGQYEEPVRPGPNRKQQDDFYLKLYFFGILHRVSEKIRFLPEGERLQPKIFRKRSKPRQSTVMERLIRIEPLAREFWCWLQKKLRKEGLVTQADVLLDATTIEAVLFARANEPVKQRFPGCRIGKKSGGKTLVLRP